MEEGVSRVSTPESLDSSEDGRSSGETNKSIPSFDCPPTFKQAELAAGESPLCIEDIEGETELWLIKAPHNFDAKKLSAKNVSLSGCQLLMGTKELDVAYEVFASRETLSDKGLPCLLLPSRHEANLVPAQAFQGHLSVVETVAIPPVLLPPSPPMRSNKLPPGLKQRFLPFGWEEPTKLLYESKKSADATDDGITEAKPKRKKPKKDKKAKEAIDMTRGSEAAERMEMIGMDRLNGSEERVVDAEIAEGITKKEHRKSKKRKKGHAQTEDRTEVNSEETVHKKKKKHKNV